MQTNHVLTSFILNNFLLLLAYLFMGSQRTWQDILARFWSWQNGKEKLQCRIYSSRLNNKADLLEASIRIKMILNKIASKETKTCKQVCDLNQLSFSEMSETNGIGNLPINSIVRQIIIRSISRKLSKVTFSINMSV